MTARVLVVDDEPAIRDTVSYALAQEGFAVDEAADGEAALELAARTPFDVVVLDIMLPGLSGIDVCRRLRSASAVPILMLTARESEVDRVVGLEVGADDYVTKPFSVAEVVARVRSLIRRRELDREEHGEAVLRAGPIEVDRVRHEVRVDGRPIELTPSEFRLLALLASEPGRAFSRRELVRTVWRSQFVGSERSCDTHVLALRRKLEADPARPRRILAVRGVGYKLAAD